MASERLCRNICTYHEPDCEFVITSGVFPDKLKEAINLPSAEEVIA